jgi:hypothetical protein
MFSRLKGLFRQPGEETARKLVPDPKITVITVDEESTTMMLEAWYHFTIECGFSYKTDGSALGVRRSYDELRAVLGRAGLEVNHPSMDSSLLSSEIHALTDFADLSKSLKSGNSVIKMAWEYEEGTMVIWYCNPQGCRIALMYG